MFTLANTVQLVFNPSQEEAHLVHPELEESFQNYSDVLLSDFPSYAAILEKVVLKDGINIVGKTTSSFSNLLNRK